jgi:hypothetical protein
MTFLLKDYCQKNDSRAADVPDLIEAISEVAKQQLPSKTVVRHEDAGTHPFGHWSYFCCPGMRKKNPPVAQRGPWSLQKSAPN